MATQTSTSHEERVKLSSEAEKGKGEKLHNVDNSLSSSEEKAVDIVAVRPPVIEARPSSEAVGEEATLELPVIAFLEKTIKEFDSSAQEEKSSDDIVQVAEKVENVSIPVDDPELSVVADSGKGPAETQEEPVTERVSVEKAQIDVVQESVEPTNKEVIETVEPLPEKEQPPVEVEVHPIKEELEQVIPKEISQPVQVSEDDKKHTSEEPREVIQTNITQLVEAPEENESLVEVHSTNESIEPLENDEQPNEITKHVEENVIVKDEKPLALSDDIGKPTEDLVDQEAESGPIELSVKALEQEQQPTEVVSVEKETTCVVEESLKSPKDEQPIEAVTSKEPAELVAKEVIETIEHPTEKKHPVETTIQVTETVEPQVIPKEKSQAVEEQATQTVEPLTEKEKPIVIAKEIREVVAQQVTETVEPPTQKEQSVVTAEEVTEAVEPPTQEVVAKQISEVVAKEVNETVEPLTEKEKPIVIAKETCEVVAKEVTETVEPPTQKEQPLEIAKEMSEVVAEEVTEAVEPPTEKEQPEVIAKQIIAETVEPPTEKEQPEVIAKEISEVVAEEVTETVEPPTEKEQPEVIAKEVTETVEPPAQNEQTVAITKETSECIEQPDEVVSHEESVQIITPKVNASFHPPKNDEQADKGFPVAEPSNKLDEEPETSHVLDLSAQPPKKEEQTIEVLTVEEQVKATTTEIIDRTELPRKIQETQESSEVTAEKISETVEILPEHEVHPVKELEVIEVLKQPNEVVSQNESLEVKEGSASFDPPKDNEQADEGFSVTESTQVISSDSTLDSEKVAKQEPQVIEVEQNVIELPELTKHIQEEVENRQESDKQVSVDLVPKSDLIQESIEKEQPVTEFVNVGEESTKEPDTTCVPELSADSLKKEDPGEVLPAVKVIEKEILEGVVEKEIIEPTQLPKEKEQTTEVKPVQESKKVIADKINECLEIPKEVIEEVQPLKELEVVAEDTKESIEPPKNQEQLHEDTLVKESQVIEKEISESFIPPNDTKQNDEGSAAAESEGAGAKETSGSELSREEVEKRELEVTDVRDGKDELAEITNNAVVESEAVENGGSTKEEKSLADGDDSMPPLGVEQIHKEEQCTMPSVELAAHDVCTMPSVELAAHDVKEDETKESSNIEEKIVKSEKADEDQHEKTQEVTLPREEVASRDFEIDAVVVEKSSDDDQKAGEKEEHKIEESIKDEKTEEVTKVSEKKVGSKQSHKHSHNLLSKVKQSLVKAKKAIIGKSPSSKTLSSEPKKDDIQVK